ncbi:MAG TPA: hypothetical protein VGP37_08265 [Candidatus Nanopelagicales bacterium]|nr:hypothetical protein [Candidatus Nanopelagicales bacterium]
MSEPQGVQDSYNPGRPWGARRPQSLLLSVGFIALAAALVWQAFEYIGQGMGGAIPFFLIFAGPGIAIYYIWYFNFRDFEADQQT